MNLDGAEVKVVEKLDLQDGDVLAVYVAGASAEQAENLVTRLKVAFLPKIVKVMVFQVDAVEMKALRAK